MTLGAARGWRPRSSRFADSRPPRRLCRVHHLSSYADGAPARRVREPRRDGDLFDSSLVCAFSHSPAQPLPSSSLCSHSPSAAPASALQVLDRSATTTANTATRLSPVPIIAIVHGAIAVVPTAGRNHNR